VSKLFEPVTFPRGKTMKNRFMLAPLTNCQSFPDGRLSPEEQRWLTMRTEGGFGLVSTCAAHVQAIGQGFPGQLGVFSEQHVEGLSGLSQALTSHGAVALVQLHHAGIRAPKELTLEQPVGPSEDAKTGARGLTTAEVEQVIEDFAEAAKRAERAGFDGVELHGAHGYLLCLFLSAQYNRREDAYGGSLANRSRIFFAILDAIRARCRADFIVGVRLSPERFGVQLPEIREVAQRLIDSGQVDFLDLSLWDCFKEPEQAELKGRSLMSYFMDLERKGVPLGVAGKIHDPADAARVLEMGADFAILGRVAILHHDYPKRLAADPQFTPVKPPVTRAYLRAEGLSEPFVRYMQNWAGFVASEPEASHAQPG
jgi:2,4-dienoyl-CoA reductase-like NADH-dependent reductase (Old Yellow Enzyme family)